MDTVTLRQDQAPFFTYPPALSTDALAAQGYEHLRNMVSLLLRKQGVETVVTAGETSIDLGSLTPQEARELVAEDGYFGVEQTSDRIVDFAIGLAGGDVSRLDAIKKGVEAGFNEALEAFGGSLPQISHDTLDAVMAKLDAWAAGTDGGKA